MDVLLWVTLPAARSTLLTQRAPCCVLWPWSGVTTMVLMVLWKWRRTHQQCSTIWFWMYIYIYVHISKNIWIYTYECEYKFIYLYICHIYLCIHIIYVHIYRIFVYVYIIYSYKWPSFFCATVQEPCAKTPDKCPLVTWTKNKWGIVVSYYDFLL